MFAHALLTMAAVSGPCGPGPSIDQVDELESRAFPAKTFAVERGAAARSDQVGPTGDVEGATYQTPRAQALQPRLKRMDAAAGCQAAPPPVSASVAPPPDPAPLAASPRSHGRRFAMTLSGGGATYSEGVPVTVPITTETRRVQTTFSLPSPSPRPTTIPINGNLAPGPVTTTVNERGVDLDVHAWSNEVGLSLTYAPDGQDSAGWRFGARLGLQDLTLKEFLTTPFSGEPQYGPLDVISVTLFCSPHNISGYCLNVYSVAAIETRQILGVPGGLQDIGQYSVRERQQRSDGEFSARYRAPLNTPVGRLDAVIGGSLAGVWYDLDEDASIAGNPLPALRQVSHRSASGPGARVSLDVAIEGRFPIAPPLRWSLLASVGVENVSLKVQDMSHASTSSKQHQTISAFEAGLAYDFNEACSVDFTVRRRDDFIILFAPSAGGGTPLPDGHAVNLYSMDSVLYSLGLSYRF